MASNGTPPLLIHTYIYIHTYSYIHVYTHVSILPKVPSHPGCIGLPLRVMAEGFCIRVHPQTLKDDCFLKSSHKKVVLSYLFLKAQILVIFWLECWCMLNSKFWNVLEELMISSTLGPGAGPCWRTFQCHSKSQWGAAQLFGCFWGLFSLHLMLSA